MSNSKMLESVYANIHKKYNKRQRKPKGQSRMDNPEKQHLVHKTQDQDKQNTTKHNTEN